MITHAPGWARHRDGGFIINDALPEPAFDVDTQRGVWKGFVPDGDVGGGNIVFPNDGFPWTTYPAGFATGSAADPGSDSIPFDAQPVSEPTRRGKEAGVPFEFSNQPVAFDELVRRFNALMGNSEA